MSESLADATWRVCPKCETPRPQGHYNKHKRQCKECRAATQRDYVARHRPQVYARNRAWQGAGGRRQSALQKYGITPAQYERMLADQGELCAICRQPCPSGRSLAVDHDHMTGEIRGLLCTRCNPMLGYAQDSPDRLAAAIAYLARFQHH